MKLSQKRTCSGCRAYDGHTQAVITCDLGFKQVSTYRVDIGLTKHSPAEPCYKPLTLDEHSEAFQIVSDARQQ